MKRQLITAASLAASLVLAGCAGGSSESAAPDRGGPTVAVKAIDGIGDVLVDASGKALYAADVESDGQVRCTDACTSFWQPLTLDSGMPTAADGVGNLDVISRPDGTRQVAADGMPLYTFSEDTPFSQDTAGSVEGNGFSDDFDGQRFTWNAVLAGGRIARGSGSEDGYSTGQGGY
jgi:predicted lipoprotein with Yx(FWY)xxD motif